MRVLQNLIREAHRRSLWQVLTLYVVGSWIGYQVIVSLYEGLGLPDWVPGLAVVLFVIGLPIVLATAFVQEGVPGIGGGAPSIDGLERAGEVVSSGARGDVPADGTRGAEETGAGPFGLFTWRRAITGGVLAFAALGLAATGFMGMRTLGIGPAATLVASGDMDVRDPIVLADFDNATDEERLGDMVTDALRIDLMASPVIRLVDESAVQRALGRMGRDGGARLDAATAREVALRDGYKAVLAGEVGRVGTGYLLTARIVTGEGTTLAAFRETADDEGELLDAIDGLSQTIRGKIGESLKSARSGEPLAQVTTASLGALRDYSEAIRLANREGQYLRALDLLEEAVATDPGFAMAHRKIAVLWSNMGTNLQRQAEAATQAYRHRDRLNERERGLAVAYYHEVVTGDVDAQIAEYEKLLARYPGEGTASNNLSILYMDRGRWEDAVAVLGRREEASPLGVNLYFNLLRALAALGRDEEVEARLAEFRERYPESPMPLASEVILTSGALELERVDSLTRVGVARFSANPVVSLRLRVYRGAIAFLRGEVRRGSEIYRDVAAEGGRLGILSGAALIRAEAALAHARLLGPVGADAAGDLIEAIPLDSISPLDRPYVQLADAYIWMDELDRAERMLDRFEAEAPPELRGTLEPHAAFSRAFIDVRRGDETALARMEAALEIAPCNQLCGLPELGYAHELIGDDDAAIDTYTRYLTVPEPDRLFDDMHARAFVLERLAELHENAGDHAAAIRYHRELIDLWRDADPALRPRVRAARNAIARLSAEG